MKDADLEQFERLICRIVGYEGYAGETPAKVKINLLERALEQLRLKNRLLDNDIRYRDFVRGEIEVRGNTVVFKAAPFKRDKSGLFHTRVDCTSPTNLQRRLLLFLLLQHKIDQHVLDIIRGFLRKSWNHLKSEDFERTQTGVMRCMTNTRLAANVLRHYGLLKYTKKEAYKTWVLSLPGIVVASHIPKNWDVDDCLDPPGRLHPFILGVWEKVRDYDKFVDALESVCRPNVEPFRECKGILDSSHKLLEKYWTVLKDEGESQKHKKERIAALILQLDALPDMDKFCRQFSDCLNIEALIKEVESSRSPGETGD